MSRHMPGPVKGSEALSTKLLLDCEVGSTLDIHIQIWYILCLCWSVYWSLTQVGSERSKYLWNQKNMQDLLGHKIWPQQTSLPACTLACVHMRRYYSHDQQLSRFLRYIYLSDLIQFCSNMALCTQAHGVMHASLHAWVDLCAQKDPACYPDSIDTLISLIRSNLAEIWACACKCKYPSLMYTLYVGPLFRANG